MKKITLLLFFILFFVNSVILGQVNSYKWDRLPSNSEINSALKELRNSLSGNISVNGQTVDNKSVKLSSVVKFHNKNLAGKSPPEDISRAIVFVEVIGIAGSTIKEYNLFQNRKTKKFGFALNGGTQLNNLNQQYQNFINYLNEKNNDSGLALGFAPSLHQKKTTVRKTKRNKNNNDISDENNSKNDDNTWTVIIGVIIAATLLGIRNRRKKLNAKKNKNAKQTNKKKKEPADYILQLNKERFDLKLNEPQNFVVKVWKVTEKSKYLVNASIRVITSDKALKIMPFSNIGTLDSQLTLKDKPTNNQFNITVTAIAEGNSFQKIIPIFYGEQNRIIVETAPDNIRSLRPNIDESITCFAQVVDANDKEDPELTKKIKFDGTRSKWIDLLEDGPYMDEGWVAMIVGASDPDGEYDISHPPQSITLGISVEYEEQNKTIRLENNLEIKLLDCQLETDLEQVTFPVTKEPSEITFKANIENCESLKDWHFDAVYMKDYETRDAKPLTYIDIKPIDDSSVNITLTGPIVNPKENEQYLRKLLVVSAQQKDEKPLERHIYVTVSQEGLFIKKGTNKKNEIEILAKKNIKKELEFTLYSYDPKQDQIIKDEQGLENLHFELISTDRKAMNIESVLKPKFSFRAMGHNAYYTMTTEDEIPGIGEFINLKYRVSAPKSVLGENTEIFIKEFIVKVKTLDVGRRIPSWQEAYEDCRRVILDYVPEGPERVKLYKILEERKELLDVEGLVELRKRIWKVAANLILAQGAEGYKDVDAWATAIVETLEWMEWAGDLAFNALVSFYMARYGRAGAVGAVAINMAKSSVIEGINFYVYEDLPVEIFFDRQYQKIVPMLMNVAKGHALSVENIEHFVTKNKVLAWTIFIACEFTYNLYQTKSLIKAAKETARQLRDELIIRKVTGHLHKNAARYKINNTDVETVLKDVEKNVKGTKGSEYVNKTKVLEIMKDPAKVRTLKNHAPDWLKRAFDRTRTKIYKEHDTKLIKHIAEKYHLKPSEIEIDDFRTPGTPDGPYNLNTDRDYRVLRKVVTNSGEVIKIEVSRERWLDSSYKIFGDLTRKPSTVSAKEWAELHQQRGTDRYDAEASADYSDHFYDSDIGEIIKTKPNILKAENGEGTLYDAKALGKMYENKVNNALEPGAIPEAYAQAKKGVHTLKKVIYGYKKMNLDTPKISNNLKSAMKVIENMHTDVRTNAKHITDATKKLNNLGYKNVGDVIKDVSDKFKDLSKHDTRLSYKQIYK